jgi:sortase A
MLYIAHFDLERWQQLSTVKLIVPRAEVNTPVTEFYLGTESWDIAPWETRIGHFQGTAGLDHPGNIVLGGHVEYPDGSNGVFHQLNQVHIGDQLQLVVGGTTRHYQVIEQKLIPADDLTVLYPTNDEQLTLITCDEASFDPTTDTYNERLVVIARREDN